MPLLLHVSILLLLFTHLFITARFELIIFRFCRNRNKQTDQKGEGEKKMLNDDRDDYFDDFKQRCVSSVKISFCVFLFLFCLRFVLFNSVGGWPLKPDRPYIILFRVQATPKYVLGLGWLVPSAETEIHTIFRFLNPLTPPPAFEIR